MVEGKRLISGAEIIPDLFKDLDGYDMDDSERITPEMLQGLKRLGELCGASGRGPIAARMVAGGPCLPEFCLQGFRSHPFPGPIIHPDRHLESDEAKDPHGFIRSKEGDLLGFFDETNMVKVMRFALLAAFMAPALVDEVTRLRTSLGGPKE